MGFPTNNSHRRDEGKRVELATARLLEGDKTYREARLLLVEDRLLGGLEQLLGRLAMPIGSTVRSLWAI